MRKGKDRTVLQQLCAVRKKHSAWALPSGITNPCTKKLWLLLLGLLHNFPPPCTHRSPFMTSYYMRGEIVIQWKKLILREVRLSFSVTFLWQNCRGLGVYFQFFSFSPLLYSSKFKFMTSCSLSVLLIFNHKIFVYMKRKPCEAETSSLQYTTLQ